ncbi:MAG: mechanosensitive ion channel domain-containing protein [Ahrensia sp.]
MRRTAYFLILVLALVCPPVGGALAQVDAVGPERVSGVERLVTETEGTISAVNDSLDDDDALVALNRTLAERLDMTLNEAVALSPRLASIRARLEQLGNQPGADEPPEPELVTQERAALIEERAQVNRLLSMLEQSSVQLRAAIDEIAEARRDLFANTLSERYDIRLAFSDQFVQDVGERWQSLLRRVDSWLGFTWRTKQGALMAVFALSALLLFMRATFGQRFFRRLIERFTTEGKPSYFAQLTTGFSFALLPFLMTVVTLSLVYGLFHFSGVLRTDIEVLLQAILVGALLLVFVWRLAEALFSPGRAQWRIIPVAQRSALPLKLLMVAMGAVTVADFLLTQFNGVFGHALTITVAKSLFTSIITGVLLVIIAFQRPFDETTQAGWLNGDNGRWASWLKWLLVGLGVTVILSAITGYIGFGRFLAQQIVFTGAILITMLIGFSAARATAAEGAIGNSLFGDWLGDKMKLSDARIDQLGLLAGLLLGGFVLLVGLPLIARFWGVDGVTIRSWVVWFFSGIQIGSITISLTGIAAGIGMFALGFWLTRKLQNVIDKNVLERGKVETGARTSIRTAIGYVGVAIAGLIGVSAAGINLSQLAFVAGALSLGIGFGLQNIVNNFVSGLILLAERPFKSGDIIEAGGYTGVVKKVNVRATEVELFDQKTVILPNSELINSSVSNWMHRNPLGRIEINIGVGYESDPKQVMDVLLEIANDHPRVLSNPEPFVAFQDFGASSLDFTLYCYLSDVSFGMGTRTEIRLEIVKRFAAHGIEIPFPKRDINVRFAGQEKPSVLDEKPEFDVIATSKTKTGDDD